MELEVGMYIRTKDGDIDRVVLPYKGVCANPLCNFKHISCERNYYDEDTIKTVSNNIIDLIEVGDYVNGLQVIRICEDCVTEEKQLELYGSISEWTEADIKWVTTKEQFENISYRIGE